MAKPETTQQQRGHTWQGWRRMSTAIQCAATGVGSIGGTAYEK